MFFVYSMRGDDCAVTITPLLFLFYYFIVMFTRLLLYDYKININR